MSAVTKAIMVDAMESEDFTLGLRSDADPELRFWRKRALGLAKTCAHLERVNRNLTDALAEAEAENLRLHEELDS